MEKQATRQVNQGQHKHSPPTERSHSGGKEGRRKNYLRMLVPRYGEPRNHVVFCYVKLHRFFFLFFFFVHAYDPWSLLIAVTSQDDTCIFLPPTSASNRVKWSEQAHSLKLSFIRWGHDFFWVACSTVVTMAAATRVCQFRLTICDFASLHCSDRLTIDWGITKMRLMSPLCVHGNGASVGEDARFSNTFVGSPTMT